MTPDAGWLDPREERVWRGLVHAHHQLIARLNRHLVQDSGLTDSEYVVLGMLAEHPDGRMTAQELCGALQWERAGCHTRSAGCSCAGSWLANPTRPTPAAR